MRYFDLHCDTLTECYLRKCGLAENELHISAKGARVFERWVQVFAVWMPDDIRGNAAWERFLGVSRAVKRETAQNGIVLCGNAKELSSAVEVENKNAALMSIEGSAALGGRLENLEKAYDIGVRIVTLTWNGACEAGGGCLDGSGLTPFGFELVCRMNSLGMIVDISHLSDKGFYDVAKTNDGPFIASHSDSRAICGNKRNLTDEQFAEIVRRGGLVGLNLYPPFLGGEDVSAVLRHIDHFLSLGGEKVLSVGADFDGARMPNGIAGIADMVKVYELLSESYGETIADRIFFGNAYDFFKSVLTGCNSCNNIVMNNSNALK